MRGIVDVSIGSSKWINICVRVEISQAKKGYSLQKKKGKVATCTNYLILYHAEFIHL